MTQCSVYPAPNSSYSSTTLTCKHPVISEETGGVPQSPRDFDRRSGIRPQSTSYLYFSKPNAVEELNQRHEQREDVSVFPRNMYTHHPFAGSVSHLIQPRDKSTHYTYGPEKERQEHTEWFSRYSYDRFPNEYGLGVQSRGYIEPPGSAGRMTTPKDAAPDRFYSEEHTTGNLTEFRQAVGTINFFF